MSITEDSIYSLITEETNFKALFTNEGGKEHPRLSAALNLLEKIQPEFSMLTPEEVQLQKQIIICFSRGMGNSENTGFALATTPGLLESLPIHLNSSEFCEVMTSFFKQFHRKSTVDINENFVEIVENALINFSNAMDRLTIYLKDNDRFAELISKAREQFKIPEDKEARNRLLERIRIAQDRIAICRFRIKHGYCVVLEET